MNPLKSSPSTDFSWAPPRRSGRGQIISRPASEQSPPSPGLECDSSFARIGRDQGPGVVLPRSVEEKEDSGCSPQPPGMEPILLFFNN